MKKFIILAVLVASTHFANAQSSDLSTNDSMTSEKSKSIEQRLVKQEQDVEALKKDNETLKKQVKQLRSAVNIGGNTRFSVSRKGSKQLIAE